MKNEKICIIMLSFFLAIAIVFAVEGTIKSNYARRLSDQLRNELIESIDTNRRLTETVGNCQSILQSIRTTTESNITTARQAIEVVEQLRIEIQELEDYLYGDSASYDYSYWDSYLGLD